MVNEIAGRRVSRLVTVIYFTITTVSFLIYGFILRSSGEEMSISPENLSQFIRIVFYSADLMLKIYALIVLISAAIRARNKSLKLLYGRLGIIFAGISLMSSAALHFANSWQIAGLYFLLAVFWCRPGTHIYFKIIPA